jgi:uncharacterized protein (TIRG00374 family)
MVADAEEGSGAGVSVTPAPAPPVVIVDSLETRVHRPADIVSALIAAVGIAVILLLAAYARATSEGVTEDIQGISALVQRLLVAPVNIFSGVVTLVIPAVVIISLAVRKEPRRILEVLGAAAVGFILTGLAALLILGFGSDELLESLSIHTTEGSSLQLPAYMAGVAAMLTAAGRRSSRRSVAISWNIMWIAAGIGVVSGIVAAPAALITILIGRVAGLGMRYVVGSTADRAYGEVLADAIVRAGFMPRRIVRANTTNHYTPPDLDDVTLALARTRVGRVYDVTTRQSHHLVVVALDGDQHVAGFISKLWSTLRLRGITARADVSLRHSAEATALVSHAARTAGVRTGRILGMSTARDTFVMVYQKPTAAKPIGLLESEELTDDLLDATWAEINKAHAASISHRALGTDTILVGASDEPVVWLTSWEFGEVATTDLARRIDRAQVLTALALLVGNERALDSAFRSLSHEDIGRFAPLLQSISLPRATRAALKERRSEKILEALREGILERLPEADVETENITRFGWRTVITLTLGLVAAALVVFGLNTQDILDGLSNANPWWLLVAFGWMLLTFVGAALAMIAFSPVKLPWNRVILVQVAAAYVALAAPAGIGPAALNLRMLTKRGVQAPLAVATVALIQVSGVFVTVTGLVALTLISGSESTLAFLPSKAILIGIGITVGVILLALLVPRVRRWALDRVRPVIRQTWPRLSQVLGQPWRLVLGLLGNLLLTLGYLGAFYAVLEGFGLSVPVVDLAVVFFVGNTVGAIVPTPGGIGAIDLALSGALTGIGIPGGLALTAVLIYRFITFWLRVPMGYAAMKYLERKGEL